MQKIIPEVIQASNKQEIKLNIKVDKVTCWGEKEKLLKKHP